MPWLGTWRAQVIDCCALLRCDRDYYMRILICSTNYFPELPGIGKYNGEMAEWLAAHGHKVRVVTAPPYYPEWRVAQGYSAWRYRRESLSGVDVWRCPLWVPKKLSGLNRILHLASFALTCLPAMLRQVFWRPDVVFVLEPPLFCAPGAWITARLSGAKAWLHVQDFEVDAAFDLGLLPSGKIRKIVLFIESFIMRRFDRVSTIAPKMAERLELKGVSPDNVVMFPNWVNTKAICPLLTNPMRQELGIPDDVVVCLYSGSMGEKQGLEILIEAARLLADESLICFVFCGGGGARERLFESGKNLRNIRWLSLQPIEKLNELLNLADIHLMPQRADAADLMMPSKLTGMLASGRPVIATARVGTGIAEVVSQCGRIVTPGDANGLIGAILELASNDDLRAVLGGRARQYAVEHFDCDAVLEKFQANI